ncbi:PAS domain-containing sensor histidine kinase [Dulcicalothrix desertica]|nr:PAS domain-containing sensor histidine kinase [Dulcicalothrix desertica]TWH42912.1 PAS domain S-box-containing protein [Dulcicalothrix desertica PCC 7102]
MEFSDLPKIGTLLNQVLESTNQVFLAFSADLSQTLYVSTAYERIWGCNAASLYKCPKSFIDFIHPDDQKRILNSLERLRLSGTMDEKYRIVTANGSIKWIHNRAFRYENTDNIEYIASLAEEITLPNLSLIDPELIDIEESFSQLLDNLDIAFWIFAPDISDCYYISSGFEKIWGYSCASIYEYPRLLFESIHPDDREMVLKACLGKENCTLEQEYRIICPDGKVRWVYQRTFVVNQKNGSSYRQVGIAEDITSRKLAEISLIEREEKFQQFANHAEIVFWVCDLDISNFYYISPGYEKIWGRPCNEIYSNPMSFLKFVHPDDIERVSAVAVGDNACNMDEEYRIIRPDGTMRWVRDRTFPIYDEDGNLFRMAGVAKDITHRKQAEEQILKALQRERELSESKTKFIATTSHEIRTPLATIQSSCDMLQYYINNLTEEKKQAHFYKIETSIKRITEIVQNLLILSEVEANALQFKPKNVDVVKLCQNIINTLINNSENQNRLKFMAPTSSIEALLDSQLVCHIITNLLENALKYSSIDSEVKLDVNFYEQAIVFNVEDQGIGIPPEDIARIFDSFYRANNVSTVSGTGLGLSIVKQCVNLHKGEIVVNSIIGKGATFSVKLPTAVQTKCSNHLKL